MKKAILIWTMLIFLLPTIVLVAYAHPGRTDSRGGHTNHSTGEYHYHHGQPAHDHYDMDGDGDIDCPYDFEDKTEHQSSSKPASKEESEKVYDWPSVILRTLAFGVYIFFMFVLPFIMS